MTMPSVNTTPTKVVSTNGSNPSDGRVRCSVCFVAWPPSPLVSVTGIRCGVCANTR
jgi:hypothetical protein